MPVGRHPLNTIWGIYAQHYGFFFYLKTVDNGLGAGPTVFFAPPDCYNR